MLAHARADFGQGEYRWVAQAMNHLVQAEPGNAQARELGADAMEQLGYQAESAVERNAYLTGAMELRSGGKTVAPPLRTASPDTIRALSIENIFDYMGVRLNAPKAEGLQIVLNWHIGTDGKDEQRYVLNLENSALTWQAGVDAPNANATLSLSRATLDRILAQQLAPREALQTGLIKVSGDPTALGRLLSLQDNFPADFEIVMPLKSAR